MMINNPITTNHSRPKRLQSIDFLRGFAIFAMVQTHIWGFYIREPLGTGLYIFHYFTKPLGGFAAPLFTIISGASAYLAYEAYVKRAYTKREISIQFFSRGLFLFILSTLINILTGPVLHILDISILNWGVIQLIGFCLILVPLFCLLSFAGRSLFFILPILLTDILYSIYPIMPWLYNGFAPFFPWSSLFWGGFLIGDLFLRSGNKQSFRFNWLTMIGSIFPLGLGLILNYYYRPFSWAHIARLNATTIFVFLGIYVILLIIFYYLFDRHGVNLPGMGVAIGLGKNALTIYYLQLFGIVAPGFLLRYKTGSTFKVDWWWYIPMVFLVILLLHFLVNHLWAKYDYFLSLEWFMSKMIKGKLPHKNKDN